MSDLKNYIQIDKVTGATQFNVNYVVENLGSDSYFKDPAFVKEFVLYVNSPESLSIRNGLISKLGTVSEIPYKYMKGGQEFTGTVKIVIEAVST